MVKQTRWLVILLFGVLVSMLPALLGDGLALQQGSQVDESSIEGEILDEELVMAGPVEGLEIKDGFRFAPKEMSQAI